jgi:LPS-assembly lipoprotein
MKHIVLYTLILLTSACGWHLKGSSELPTEVKIMTLESQANNRFTQRLKQQLLFNGVIFPSDASANVRLVIEPIAIRKITLSVTTLGQAAEYELNADLTVQLIQLEEGTKTEWNFSGRRVFNNDVDSVIATQYEETFQRQELENSLIRQLMNRLEKSNF